MEKILSISLKLKFTPNTSGCYGLSITRLVILLAIFSQINLRSRLLKLIKMPFAREKTLFYQLIFLY